MSSKKKKSKEEEEEVEDKLPIAQRRSFNIIYNVVMYSLFAIGVGFIVLSSTNVLGDASWPFLVSLGIIGLAIVLFTMRSSFRATAPLDTEEEKEEKDEGLKMRERR